MCYKFGLFYSLKLYGTLRHYGTRFVIQPLYLTFNLFDGCKPWSKPLYISWSVML